MPGHRWRSAAAGWLRQAADSLSPRESGLQDSDQDGKDDGGRPGGSAGGGPQGAGGDGAGLAGADFAGAGPAGVGFANAGSGTGRRFDVAGAPEHWVNLLRQAGLVPGVPWQLGTQSPQADVGEAPGPGLPAGQADAAGDTRRAAAGGLDSGFGPGSGPGQADAGQPDGIPRNPGQGRPGPRLESAARRIPRLVVGRRAAEQQTLREPEIQRDGLHSTSRQAPPSAPQRSRATTGGQQPAGQASTGSGPSTASAEPHNTAAPAAAGSPAGTGDQPGSKSPRDPFRFLPTPAARDPRQALTEYPSRELPWSGRTPSGLQNPGVRQASAPTTGPTTLAPAANPAARPPSPNLPIGRRQPGLPDPTRPLLPQPPAERTDGYEGRSAVVGAELPLPVEKVDPPPRPALAGQWPELPQSQARQAPAMPPERMEHLLTRTLRLRDEQRAV